MLFARAEFLPDTCKCRRKPLPSPCAPTRPPPWCSGCPTTSWCVRGEVEAGAWRGGVGWGCVPPFLPPVQRRFPSQFAPQHPTQLAALRLPCTRAGSTAWDLVAAGRWGAALAGASPHCPACAAAGATCATPATGCWRVADGEWGVIWVGRPTGWLGTQCKPRAPAAGGERTTPKKFEMAHSPAALRAHPPYLHLHLPSLPQTPA